ncbi:gluconolactonase [Acetobacter sacchari]|uniref:Gluconolactonase n=1 Tax=Acetobacter sacchari TaxID=2661687 RepID=A0ABS3M0J6_9PROT|nr:L-dopachrome tautomerase-related protein [Acetobacter sacchari]MBO1361653.1 gluconolactonase [Acetobacter sacchari]
MLTNSRSPIRRLSSLWLPDTRPRAFRSPGALALVASAAVAILLPTDVHAVPMPIAPEAAAADLTPIFTSSSQLWDVVVALPDGRVALQAPRWLGGNGPQLSIARENEMPAAYPNAAWNAADGPVDEHFVALAGITLAPDGQLWAVDSGVPDREKPPTADARLVEIDTHSDSVTRVLSIDPAALRPGSVLGGIAIHGRTAYVLDSGVAGLLVIDLGSGVAQRFMDHHPALTAGRPIQARDGVVAAPDGRPIAIDANLIAVSPDGKWLYVQAYCGPLYRVNTAFLDDPASTGAAFQEAATLWYKTGALGGLAVGHDGTLYWSDVATGSVDSYTPGRIPHHLITDPRLTWPGGLALAPDGRLIIPAAQLDRAPRFHQGHSAVVWPETVYALHTPADATSDVLRK